MKIGPERDTKLPATTQTIELDRFEVRQALVEYIEQNKAADTDGKRITVMFFRNKKSEVGGVRLILEHVKGNQNWFQTPED